MFGFKKQVKVPTDQTQPEVFSRAWAEELVERRIEVLESPEMLVRLELAYLDIEQAHHDLVMSRKYRKADALMEQLEVLINLRAAARFMQKNTKVAA